MSLRAFDRTGVLGGVQAGAVLAMLGASACAWLRAVRGFATQPGLRLRRLVASGRSPRAVRVREERERVLMRCALTEET